jgi:hypothetical protein
VLRLRLAKAVRSCLHRCAALLQLQQRCTHLAWPGLQRRPQRVLAFRAAWCACVQVGMVHATRPSEDDARTLKAIKFQTGDYMDVAVHVGYI